MVTASMETERSFLSPFPKALFANLAIDLFIAWHRSSLVNVCWVSASTRQDPITGPVSSHLSFPFYLLPLFQTFPTTFSNLNLTFVIQLWGTMAY
jgi:hypothetical protein